MNVEGDVVSLGMPLIDQRRDFPLLEGKYHLSVLKKEISADFYAVTK